MKREHKSVNRENWAQHYMRRYDTLVKRNPLDPFLPGCLKMAMWYLILAEAERQGDL